jgi:hypothetical protein
MDGRSIIRDFNLALPAKYQAKGYFRTSADLKTEENWILWKSR